MLWRHRPLEASLQTLSLFYRSHLVFLLPPWLYILNPFVQLTGAGTASSPVLSPILSAYSKVPHSAHFYISGTAEPIALIFWHVASGQLVMWLQHAQGVLLCTWARARLASISRGTAELIVLKFVKWAETDIICGFDKAMGASVHGWRIVETWGGAFTFISKRSREFLLFLSSIYQNLRFNHQFLIDIGFKFCFVISFSYFERVHLAVRGCTCAPRGCSRTLKTPNSPPLHQCTCARAHSTSFLGSWLELIQGWWLWNF